MSLYGRYPTKARAEAEKAWQEGDPDSNYEWTVEQKDGIWELSYELTPLEDDEHRP